MELHEISQRDQNIIEHLTSLWQYSSPVTSEHLKAIIEMFARFSAEASYQEIGLQKIAEYLASSMNIHMLSLLAVFLQKAQEEEMRPERVMKVLDRVLPSLFTTLSFLPQDIHTSSLDDLSVLANIAVGLQELSQTDSALEAQSWLHDLPKTYYQQLKEEHVAFNTTAPKKTYMAKGPNAPYQANLSSSLQITSHPSFSSKEVTTLTNGAGYVYLKSDSVRTEAS